MKQIPSQFLDDDEYDKLILVKEKKGWTWKDLLLYHIKEGINHETDTTTDDQGTGLVQ